MSRLHGRLARAVSGIGLCLLAGSGWAAESAPAPAGAVEPLAAVSGDPSPAPLPAGQRSGREIFEAFSSGLSDQQCSTGVSERWSRHFAHAPDRLAQQGDGLLPLFGYVVDELRRNHLPTEYALIPFVESGYKPAARSPAGPAGMWQMIKVTARNHQVPITGQYDGRLSPVDSTRAAVRYIKTLHGMFGGDWRLAVMAYNAGEYRVFGALKRAGVEVRDASPQDLPGMPGITQAYVRKIHALSCLIVDAGEDADWLRAVDRPVARLQPLPVPAGTRSIEAFAAEAGQSTARLERLNPIHADGRIRRPGSGETWLLGVAGPADAARTTTLADASAAVAADAPLDEADVDRTAHPRVHTVARGENPWTIARRYDLQLDELLQRNNLQRDSVLRVGQRLQLTAEGDHTAPPR
ncbi:transglycosylase SLT domain-containing protein [Lysobacter sp. SG-8]|uniref:Transglycosylase SLT domain-containing protein n=1 Tax=Marilutibacter penaei TaxID=2759900 RepID=A0A7W3U566_9GAMM|nr:lytic transglycosylase domain-containing protein [Lysobacter penaei]MBB1089068.1 transglycosylase SLT domain-containing protein [Lysobacter penaei]